MKYKISTYFLSIFLVLMSTFLIIMFRSSPNFLVNNLRIDDAYNPIGIGDINPQMTCDIKSPKSKNTLQVAYQIQVSMDSNLSKPHVMWDASKTISSKSITFNF